MRIFPFSRTLLAALGAVLCLAGLEAATPNKRLPSKAPSSAVRKQTVKRQTGRRRAPLRRAVAKPLPPNPQLAGVTAPSPVVMSGLFTIAPPPAISGTCYSCADPLLATAYSQLGVRYRLGGTTPETGFDCSGLMKYAYKMGLDVPLPSSAPAQFQVGVPVGKEELLPGDLVFFRPRRYGWHVGMYVGDGAFIHAPNRRRTVSVTNLDEPYWRSAYVGARRIPVTKVEEAPTTEAAANN